METKKCTKCKKIKNIGEFYKDTRYNDRMYQQCKKCKNRYRIKKYKKVKKTWRKIEKTWRKIIKNIRKKVKKTLRKKTKTQLKIKSRNRMREWRKNNPERNKKNQDKSQKRYREKNPEWEKANNRKRRAKKLNAEGSHTEQEWLDKKKEYNYKCFYCGIHESELKYKYKDKRWWKLTEDHLTPLSKEGTDYIDNIVPACISCNSSKNNKAYAFKGLMI